MLDINEPPQLPTTIRPLRIDENSAYGTAAMLMGGTSSWLNVSDPESHALTYSVVEICTYSIVENTSCVFPASSGGGEFAADEDDEAVDYFSVSSGGSGGVNDERFQTSSARWTTKLSRPFWFASSWQKQAQWNFTTRHNGTISAS